MRTVIGLLGLGLVAGVVPTGVLGSAQAGLVLLGTVGALTCLLVCCLAGPIVGRWAAPALRPATAAPRRQTSPIVSPQSASRSI